MRTLLVLALLAGCAYGCTVSPAPGGIVVSDCNDPVVVPRGGPPLADGTGFYALPDGPGCSVVTVSGAVYTVCGEVRPVACEGDPVLCAERAFLACAGECCRAEPCCTEPETVTVTYSARHAWGNLTGTDGLALQPNDGRVRALPDALLASCEVPGGCDAACVLGEDSVTTRALLAPCENPVFRVRVVASGVSPPVTLGLGASTQPLTLGPNVVLGASGPLTITARVPECGSGDLYTITELEYEATCTATVERPVECPPEGKCVPGAPQEDPINTPPPPGESLAARAAGILDSMSDGERFPVGLVLYGRTEDAEVALGRVDSVAAVWATLRECGFEDGAGVEMKMVASLDDRRRFRSSFPAKVGEPLRVEILFSLSEGMQEGLRCLVCATPMPCGSRPGCDLGPFLRPVRVACNGGWTQAVRGVDEVRHLLGEGGFGPEEKVQIELVSRENPGRRLGTTGTTEHPLPPMMYEALYGPADKTRLDDTVYLHFTPHKEDTDDGSELMRILAAGLAETLRS